MTILGYTWNFALTEEKEHVLVFSLPWKQLLAVAVVFAVIGGSFFHPALSDNTNPFLRLFVIGASLVLSGGFAIIALASHGELKIEGTSKMVRFRFETPWSHVSWIKPFDHFQQIQFRQVVDGHGLHNHWRIELVLKKGMMFQLGYGLFGTFRRATADSLIHKVVDVMGIPVVELEKR